eukprot:s1235_g23.t1
MRTDNRVRILASDAACAREGRFSMIAEVQHFRFRLEFGSVLLCIGSLVGRANTLSVHADSASASFSFRFFMGLRDYSYRINVKVDQGHDSAVWSLLGSGGPNYIVSASDRFGQSTEISFHFDARGLPAQPLLQVGDVPWAWEGFVSYPF